MRYVVALLVAFFGAACSTPTGGIDAAALDAGDDAAAADAPLVDAFSRDADWSDAGPMMRDHAMPGPFVVGNARTTMLDRTGMRMLPVEIWYPADSSASAAAMTGQPMTGFETGTPNASMLASLVSSAPATCIRGQTQSAPAPMAALARTPYPAVVFSHCHGCVRFDVAAIAERLASNGIVVAAPDHLGDTLWDATLPAIGEPYLSVRVSDVSSVLDRLLDASAMEVPSGIRGHVDASHVGVMGHSYGALTTGAVVLRDPRFVAALAIAAPISITGNRPSDVRVPFLFALMQEDNSIGSVGNRIIRSDYAMLGGPAWLIEVADAGHFTFTDIAGLHASWDAGCGMGHRQDPPHDPFTYIDNTTGRALGAHVAAAFFAAYLQNDPGALNELSGLGGPAFVSMHP
jgi:predicted dienelactone hydrolase